jgi:hypothetical protein
LTQRSKIAFGALRSIMPLDLRQYDATTELDRVITALDVKPDPATEIRKRRSVGFRTDRNTWVRIEHQSMAQFARRGNDGLQAAMVLEGVTKPAWYQALSWIDQEEARVWRADETEYVAAPHVIPYGYLRQAPTVSATWWDQFNASLDALSNHATSRVAVRQARITEAIAAVFPEVDTTVDDWTTAHGDLYWQNLTAPDFYMLDWEDWGTAPRGWDAASLWHNSLLVPELAAQVATARRTDLDTRSGQLSQLMRCAEVLQAPPGYADDFLEPSRIHAQRLVDQLTSPA